MRVMVLTDGKRITVSEREEINISSMLNDQDLERIEVHGVPYKKTLIGYFDMPTSEETEANRFIDPWHDAKTLPAGNGCHSTKSIQSEINNLARKNHLKRNVDNPEGWPWQSLIRDADWREMMRVKLLKESPKWCDAKSGKCVCDA